PAPLSPRRPRTSPRRISRLTLFRARMPPKCLLILLSRRKQSLEAWAAGADAFIAVVPFSEADQRIPYPPQGFGPRCPCSHRLGLHIPRKGHCCSRLSAALPPTRRNRWFPYRAAGTRI